MSISAYAAGPTTSVSSPAVTCGTGSWRQHWSCGLHAPANAHLAGGGYFAGNNLALWVGLALAVVAIVAAMRERRRRTA
jgi:hypothetical protein